MALTAKLHKLLLGGYLWEPEFQNSEYEVHQVGPKDSGSQNFSFLALKAEPVDEVQILRAAMETATATARDRRKIFYRLNHVF
jgi:hypothetical protein